jgi:sugar lactone lactonase YvrE
MRQSRLRPQRGQLSPVRIAMLTAAGLVLAATIAGAGSATASPAAGYAASYISTASAVMPGPIAVDTATDTIYCAGYNPNDIFEYELAVVDGSSGAVVANVDLASYPSYPSSIAVDSATDTIYVAYGSKIAVINGATNTVSATVALPAGTTAG